MKPIASMNMIPFIDIMLVLLAVVLTTATFVAQGKIPLTLPAAQSAQPLSSEAGVTISIGEAGQYQLDSRSLSLVELEASLATLSLQTPITLRVDQAVPFHHFVAVIDQLKTLGLANLSILTRRETP